MLRENTLKSSPHQKVFSFKHKLQNSKEILEISCSLLDNINFIVDLITTQEQLLKISQVRGRNRFFSEDPKEEIIEASI